MKEKIDNQMKISSIIYGDNEQWLFMIASECKQMNNEHEQYIQCFNTAHTHTPYSLSRLLLLPIVYSKI